MIKLSHIVKYYNKNKPNQITVCNDISLTFPNAGLVVILGPSGSGKTTLLNVISGMDKFDKGSLQFGKDVFEDFNQKKWDQIRKHKIGRVYQNYYLLKGKTVYDNIAPVILMQGVTDKQLILSQIDYLLKAVGLENYQDRLIKQLSGGQQQRVAFARALANNPDVVLADEPTGNLDSKTTVEMMSIIKEISKTRLVIMVTHEQALSDYYADRVIELENGIVKKDHPNKKKPALNLMQEHIIKLYELDKVTLNEDNLSVNRYQSDATFDKLDIDLIERNKTLYVKVHSDSIKRMKYIDDKSEITLQNSPKEDLTKLNPFKFDTLVSSEKSETDGHIFRWKDLFRFAFDKTKEQRGKNKFLFLVLILVGIIFGISIGMLGELNYVEEPFNIIDANYITVHMDDEEYYDYEDVADIAGVKQLMLVKQPFDFSISTPTFYQVKGSIKTSAQPIDIKFFDESTLIYGEEAQDYEVIIDKSVADELIRDYAYRGIETYDDIINSSFVINTHGYKTGISFDSELHFDIAGIANNQSKSVWMKEELIYSFVTPSLIDYRILKDQFSIQSGELPTGPNNVMLNSYYPSVLDGDIPYNVGTDTGSYFISGVYDYEVDGISYNLSKVVISKLEYMKQKYFRYTTFRYNDFNVLVYTNSLEQTEAALNEAGHQTTANIYQPTLARQLKIEENKVLYFIGLSGIIISAMSIYLVIRSDLISRMYEISVYRSIGISRKEIRRLFLVEIGVTTSISTILGFLGTVLILYQVQVSLPSIPIAHFTIFSVLGSIVGLYLINILFGIIPIINVLRKTPTEIMKHHEL
ncbi:MAG: ABC transporter ATP-binding protein/permease [Candidatus Izimaplasma sp.]|nr:ABC transporter ATP-binding protein/permease [Candidatus Izimaplasma bacterium]